MVPHNYMDAPKGCLLSADLQGTEVGRAYIKPGENTLRPVFNNKRRRLGAEMEAFPPTSSVPE